MTKLVTQRGHGVRFTADQVRDVLRYEPETGKFFWRVSRGTKREGAPAGCVMDTGYVYISVAGVMFGAHRLAWLLSHGSWPTGGLDHVDGDRSNNRLVNLRMASCVQNGQNQRRAHRDCRSGLLGAHWEERKKLWRANIRADGRQRSLGYFKTPEEAHAAYLRAKQQLHPFQTLVAAGDGATK